ncbi:MAG: hypothetical protein K6B65_05115 [Bacilli bacterium]|nr:hypothetical protein [Bacilli bacterium]
MIISIFLSMGFLSLAIVGTATLSEGFPLWLMVLSWILFGVFLLFFFLTRIIMVLYYVRKSNGEEKKKGQ